MALNIGRQGSVAVALQTGLDVPANPTDFAFYTDNKLAGKQDTIENDGAYGIREKNFSSVAGKRWSEGEIGIYADSKMAGYFLVAAMGSVTVNSLGSSCYDHTISRNDSNQPQLLSIISDRVVDKQLYPNCAVDELTLEVSDSLVKMSSKLKGYFPSTTTSGSITTTSGNLFSFKDAYFAFGSSPSQALAAGNLKPSSFKLTVKNNTDTSFRHGNNQPGSIDHKEFEVSAETTVFFENTTQRDLYYNSTKRSTVFKLTGAGIGGGFSESLTVNFYQTHVETYEIETGLANFYAEKINIMAEYDNGNAKSVDMVLRNNKALYI